MGFGFGTGGIVFFVGVFVLFFFPLSGFLVVSGIVWHWKQVLAATKCFFGGPPSVVVGDQAEYCSSFFIKWRHGMSLVLICIVKKNDY